MGLWSVACLVVGGRLFVLLLVRILADSRPSVGDLRIGKAERGVLDQLDDLILRVLKLLIMELNSLAPLADFGPADDIVGGDPQLCRLALVLHGFFGGLPGLGDFADLVEYLRDQRGCLAVGGGALLPAGRLHEFV